MLGALSAVHEQEPQASHLHHGNASARATGASTMGFLADNNAHLVLHLPCSPDLLPSDWFFVSSCEEATSGGAI